MCSTHDTDATMPAGTGATDRFDAAVVRIHFNADGLVPTIAQDAATGEVLMMAWMNEAAVREALAIRRSVYWSRSRKGLVAQGQKFRPDAAPEGVPYRLRRRYSAAAGGPAWLRLPYRPAELFF